MDMSKEPDHPRLAVHYSDDGVALVWRKQSGDTEVLLLDVEAATWVADGILRAIEDFKHHRKLIAEIDDSFPDHPDTKGDA